MNLNRLAVLLRRESRRLGDPAVERVNRTARDPYRVLVSCVISLRTKDEVTEPASRRLFAFARTPAAMLRTAPARIRRAIYPASFFRVKTRQIRAPDEGTCLRFDGPCQ